MRSIFFRAEMEESFIAKLAKIARRFAGEFSQIPFPLLGPIGTIIYCYLQTTAFLWMIAMVMKPESLFDLFERFGNTISCMSVFVMSTYYIRHERRVTSLSYKFADRWVQYHRTIRHPDGIKVIKHCELRMKYAYYFLTSGSFFVFLAYSSYPFIRHYATARTRNIGRLPFPIKVYVPFETSIGIHYLLYTHLCINIGYYCILLAVISAQYISMFCMLDASFKLNAAFYERIRYPQLADYTRHQGSAGMQKINGRWNTARLVVNVNEHQILFRMGEELKALSRLILFIFYAGGTGAVAFSSFLAAVDPVKYGHSTMLVLITMMHLYMFFYLSSEVANACQITAKTLYAQHWALQQEAGIDGRSLLFILMRSQKPIIFEAGNIRKLTQENFVSFLQYTYSFIMVLRFCNSKKNLANY